MLPGGNTFSDVDCIRYGKISSISEIVFDRKSEYSFKEVINCPNRAWTRSEQKYYRLTLLGRTGKKNPRMGKDFIKWTDEESIIRAFLDQCETLQISDTVKEQTIRIRR